MLHYYCRKQHRNIENSQIIKQNVVICLSLPRSLSLSSALSLLFSSFLFSSLFSSLLFSSLFFSVLFSSLLFSSLLFSSLSLSPLSLSAPLSPLSRPSLRPSLCPSLCLLRLALPSPSSTAEFFQFLDMHSSSFKRHK